MTETPEERQFELLKTAFGPQLYAYLENPGIIEIMVNPDGSIVVEDEQCKTVTDQRIPSEQAANIVRLVAALENRVVNEQQPEISGTLPQTGARFQGWLPPVVHQPTFAIRKYVQGSLTLYDYVERDLMSQSQADHLKQAVENKLNIVIAGGAGSGKTTLATAILRQLENKEDRVFILEDLPEIKLNITDQVVLRTSASVTMRDLIRSCLRMRPDRIIIGEVRDGSALDLLKAWNTGHPGGLCTLHANNADSVYSRLRDLVSEVVPSVPQGLLTQTIDMIIELDGSKQLRGRVTRLAEVRGEDRQGLVLRDV